MNQLQKEIMIGTLLGDSSLQTFTNGKTWRARFIQGSIHKDYLFHLYDIFKDYVKTPPKCIIDNFGNKRWYFNTRTSSDFLDFANLFYKKKGSSWKKCIKSCNFHLSPISLSYWYMDDGSLKKVGDNFYTYIFCTDSFNLSELKILSLIFKKEYNIYISFHRIRENQYRIYIPKKYTFYLKDIMKPYIIQSMEYKLNL